RRRATRCAGGAARRGYSVGTCALESGDLLPELRRRLRGCLAWRGAWASPSVRFPNPSVPRARHPTPHADVNADPSLDVLYLFAELLHLALRGQHEVGDPRIAGLRARRVEFSVDLLEEELDPLSDRTLGAHGGRERCEVALEPDELLGDVA